MGMFAVCPFRSIARLVYLSAMGATRVFAVGIRQSVSPPLPLVAHVSPFSPEHHIVMVPVCRCVLIFM